MFNFEGTFAETTNDITGLGKGLTPCSCLYLLILGLEQGVANLQLGQQPVPPMAAPLLTQTLPASAVAPPVTVGGMPPALPHPTIVNQSMTQSSVPHLPTMSAQVSSNPLTAGALPTVPSVNVATENAIGVSSPSAHTTITAAPVPLITDITQGATPAPITQQGPSEGGTLLEGQIPQPTGLIST